MSANQNQKSGNGKLFAGAAVVAAGAGAYYYHKDMSQEELKEAGEMYMAKTKEYSVSAYETAKPYVVMAADKTVCAAKCAYAKLMAAVSGEESTMEIQEQESVAETEAVEEETMEVESEAVVEEEEEVQSEL